MIINNLEDLCHLICVDTPDQLQRQVYKCTACGGNMAFRVRKDGAQDEEFWEYAAPSTVNPGWSIVGIKLISIVEGSDVTYDGDPLLFPFTAEQYREQEKQMEAFCDEEWTLANQDEDRVQTYEILRDITTREVYHIEASSPQQAKDLLMSGGVDPVTARIVSEEDTVPRIL